MRYRMLWVLLAVLSILVLAGCMMGIARREDGELAPVGLATSESAPSPSERPELDWTPTSSPLSATPITAASESPSPVPMPNTPPPPSPTPVPTHSRPASTPPRPAPSPTQLPALPPELLPTPPILIKSPERADVYLVLMGLQRYIPDWDTFLNVGYREKDILTDVPAGSYPDGPAVTRVVRGLAEEVYWLEDGRRQHIPDMATFRQLGYTEQDITHVPDEFLFTWPLGEPLPSVLGTPPRAMPPPSQERMALTYHPPGMGSRTVELYTVYTDGRLPRRLSYTGANQENLDPAWSPEGAGPARIAFTACTDGSSGSCAVNVTDVQAWRPVLLAEPMTHGPAWSPDGSRLASWSTRTVGVYVMDMNGMAVRWLGGGRTPAWTPDGRIVFWAGDASAFRLIVADADGQNARPVETEIEVFDQRYSPWRRVTWFASAGPSKPTQP